MRSRYRKIHVCMWGDQNFAALSDPQPNGKSLFQYLLTGPETGIIPGLYRAREGGLADALGWPVEGFREAFAEVCGEAARMGRQGSKKALVHADWRAGVVWVPSAIKYNKPESPNVVRSWKEAWAELPECELKLKAYGVLRDYVKGMGEGFRKAFDEAIGNPFGQGCPNQEQEQEQEQEEEYTERARGAEVDDVDESLQGAAGATHSAPEAQAQRPPAPRRPRVEQPPLPPVPPELDVPTTLALVRREYSKRYAAAHAGDPPGWPHTAIEHARVLAAWLDKRDGDTPKVLDRLLAGFFADEWAIRNDFPLGALANRPAKYLSPPKTARDPKAPFAAPSSAEKFRNPTDLDQLFGPKPGATTAKDVAR